MEKKKAWSKWFNIEFTKIYFGKLILIWIPITFLVYFLEKYIIGDSFGLTKAFINWLVILCVCGIISFIIMKFRKN